MSTCRRKGEKKEIRKKRGGKKRNHTGRESGMKS